MILIVAFQAFSNNLRLSSEALVFFSQVNSWVNLVVEALEMIFLTNYLIFEALDTTFLESYWLHPKAAPPPGPPRPPPLQNGPQGPWYGW